MKVQNEKKSDFKIVEFSLIDPYEKNPFRLYEGKRKEDMIESIRQSGILQPLILHAKNDGRYTVLSGHNRIVCAHIAELTGAPAIIKHNLTAKEERTYIYETNLLQRSFADFLPSEKAAIIAEYHSELFSQGKRNDIIEEIESLENLDNATVDTTSAKISRSSGARESLAVEYSLNASQVAQLLRVNKLIEPLAKRLDYGEFAVSTGSSLSFLTQAEQSCVDKCIELNGFTVDTKKSSILRKYSKAMKLGNETAYLILNGEIGKPPKKNRTPTVKVTKTLYAKYFKPEQSAKDIQKIVEEALAYYFSQQHAPTFEHDYDVSDEDEYDLEP